MDTLQRTRKETSGRVREPGQRSVPNEYLTFEN